MANVIKYRTTTVDNTIKKGNFALGINDVDYGPTNITGFYATTTPSTSGYTIYNENGGTLSYESVSGATPLINYLSNKRGVTMTTAGEALSWAAGQSNIFVTNRDYENIVTSGMVLNLDAGFVSSYPTSATTWYDLSYSGNNGTLTNGPTFSSLSGGSIVFDGTDDYTNFVTTLPSSTIYSVSSWFYTDTGNWNGALFGFGTNESPNTQDVYLFGNAPSGCPSPIGGSFGFNTWNCDSFGIGNASTLLKGTGFHHVVATFNHQNVRNNQLWLDGVLQPITQQIGTTNFSANLNNQFKIASNGWYTAEQLWRGRVSNLQAYTRLLSPFEVYQNYNAMKGRFGIPDIVTSGLTLNLDAGNPYSYNPLITGSTTWTDVSGNGNNGTLINGTFYSGGTMIFDGVDNYIDASKFSLGKNFTIDMFLKPSTNTAGQCFIGKHDSSGGNYLVLGYYAGYHVRIYTQFTESIPITLNWQHIVLTVETLSTTTNINLYRDGVLLYNNTFTVTLPDAWDTTGKDFSIGQDWDGVSSPSDFFNGNIGTTKIYNRVLTISEIQQNFNALRGRYGI
jgi:hypothetical protein